MRLILLLILSVGTFSAQAKVLVDETWGSRTTYDMDDTPSSTNIKGRRKVGIQSTFSGAQGLIGLNLAINFSKEFTFSFGPGLSRGFKSFNAHVKYALGGQDFIPYAVGGYSHWYAKEEGKVERTSPPIVGDKFLSSREKQTGTFAEHIIYPGIGLEYINSSGDFVGLGFFAEILLLIDVDDFLLAPTAGLGTTYYF